MQIPFELGVQKKIKNKKKFTSAIFGLETSAIKMCCLFFVMKR